MVQNISFVIIFYIAIHIFVASHRKNHLYRCKAIPGWYLLLTEYRKRDWGQDIRSMWDTLGVHKENKKMSSRPINLTHVPYIH